MCDTESLESSQADALQLPVASPKELPSHLWIHNKKARTTVLTAFSAFYCIVITIIGFVFELSHLLSNERRRTFYVKDLVFGLYMYGLSLLFFAYCYAVLLLNPKWCLLFKKLKKSWSSLILKNSIFLEEGTIVSTDSALRKVSHNSPSAGSLFLRLGCVVFGVTGMVYHSFSTFLCVIDDDCNGVVAVFNVAAIVFTFTQMHFIFCNWRMSITGSQLVARFGTMHLISANLWTWIRFIMIEESIMDQEIRQIFYKKTNITESDSKDYVSDEAAAIFFRSVPSESSIKCKAAECLLGSMTELMYTSIVEYSLLGAAVMFIVWRNTNHARKCEGYVKRKHQIRIDCSKTTSVFQIKTKLCVFGLFLGLIYLSATFTAMAIFYGYAASNQSDIAATVYGITDIIQYLSAGVGCGIALWKMRLLKFDEHSSHNSSSEPQNQILLDHILLSLGFIGELVYSAAGIVGLTADRQRQSLTITLIIMHITRLIQTGIQAVLIYIAGNLRIQNDDKLRQSQPGKQTITFLLVANISMFLMNLFEAEKAGVSESVVNFYGKKSWVFLVRSFSPLTIFYRFHSSVCLAEIWKNVYSGKQN